ncbi:hypothetical protein FOPE_09335 [Fonsecaea pedrosoi]|nr:hypothetical protein FOPE_09335 [Fonsecaea pedrosoi]
MARCMAHPVPIVVTQTKNACYGPKLEKGSGYDRPSSCRICADWTYPRSAVVAEDNNSPGDGSHSESRSVVDHGNDKRQSIPARGTSSAIELNAGARFDETLNEVEAQIKSMASISVEGEKDGRSNAWGSTSGSSSTRSFLHEPDLCVPLPDEKLQWKLFQYYIDWVHPQLPFLDIQQVAERAMTEDFAGSKTTFTLLIQAIFYAGSLYALEDDFRSSYYESQRHAQRTLAHLAKASFSTNRDDDSLLLSQAALLLSMRATPSLESLHISRYWLKVCVNRVQRLTFVQYMQSDGRASAQPRNQRHADLDSALVKLVWSIRVQELTMMLGSGEGSYMHTHVEGFLSPTYLSINPDRFSPELWHRMSGSISLQDARIQELLANLFYAKLRLSALIDKVLQSVSSGEDSGPTGSESEDLSYRLALRLSSLPADCLLSHEISLAQWWDSIPSWMRCAGPPDHDSSEPVKSWRLVSFHRALLGIAYQTFSMSICQARVMREGQTQSSLYVGAIQQQKIEAKVREMLDILDYWVPDENLGRLLTATGPRLAHVCIPALSRTAHGSSDIQATLRNFDLINKNINYLLKGTLGLAGHTAGGSPLQSGDATSQSATDRRTHRPQQCDAFPTHEECHAQDDLARYLVGESAKLDRKEGASAECQLGDPELLTVRQVDNGENDIDTGGTSIPSDFLVLESTEDNWPNSPGESDEAMTTAPSLAGEYHGLNPLSPFASAWLEFDSESESLR